MKILVVLPRFPYPLEKGDKLRAYYQIRELAKYHEVYLFCISHSRVLPDDKRQLEPYCKSIRIVSSPKLVNYKNVVRNYFSTKSLQMGFWDSLRSRKAYKAFERNVQPDVIYNQMLRTMTFVSRSNCPKVMDFQDALSMNTERRMNHARGLWHYILHFEFKMLRSTEYNAFKFFDALTIISEPDADAIPQPKKMGHKLHIIPNGVDTDYFHPIDCKKDFDVVFCGNMSYEPNVRASRYLAKEVMPIVWKTIPNARLLLAGAYPKGSVRELAGDRVVVSGYVEDIRMSYASARVFAAPLLTGSGLQNKLLEAMSMQLPCVTTSIANDSLNAEAGKEVLVGDNAQQFADHIISLLQNPEANARLAQNGHDFVSRNFSWETSGQQLEAILREACAK